MKISSKPSHLALLLAATATASWAAPLAGGAAHPIVDLQSGTLLGGSVGGRWVKATLLARSMKGGESYRAYASNRFVGSGQGSRPASSGAPCDDTLFLDVKPKRGEFALGASWNALPRAPRPMSLSQPAYRAQVAAFLKQYGIARPTVRLDQVWRVDLDGDGEPEVLVSATNHRGRALNWDHVTSSASAGDYSLVLLRKVVGGKLKTMVLDAEIYPRAKTFNAPSVFRIAGVLDANGDGKMEVLLRGRYYEGSWSSVYEVRGGKAVEVLTEGCGV